MLSVKGLAAFILLALSVKASDSDSDIEVPVYLKGEFLLESGLTGKYLTATSNNDGALVTVESFNDGAGQKWNISNGNLQTFGNKCLDVPDGKRANGVNLQVWTCSQNNPNQFFVYTEAKHLITARMMCVGISGESKGDSTPVQTWGCNNQVWNTHSIPG